MGHFRDWLKPFWPKSRKYWVLVEGGGTEDRGVEDDIGGEGLGRFFFTSIGFWTVVKKDEMILFWGCERSEERGDMLVF